MTTNSGFPYKTFETWYAAFKQGAAEENPQLEISGDGRSLLDFMDHTPLREAFSDLIEPRSLGRSFAAQYDFNYLLSMQKK